MRHAHTARSASQRPGFPSPSEHSYPDSNERPFQGLSRPVLGKPGLLKALAVATLSATLAACGGSGTGNGPEAEPETPVNPDKPDTPNTRHALIINLDGATYQAVQQGIAAGSLPNLAKLHVQLAYSGGVAGTPSQQANLDMPSWASLLTGTWANRHGVVSTATDQVLRQNSLFYTEQKGQNAAAVASKGLAHLLKPDHDAERLHQLADCSTQTVTLSCVSSQALTMIEGDYRKVLVQYRSAKDAALDFGIESPDYRATLSKLDKEIGTLLDAAAKQKDREWLVIVTGNHGLSEHGQDNGLPLLPQSTTFLAMNQAVNTGEHGIGASVPATLPELYQYNSLVDVAPTIQRYLDKLPRRPTTSSMAAACWALKPSRVCKPRCWTIIPLPLQSNWTGKPPPMPLSTFCGMARSSPRVCLRVHKAIPTTRPPLACLTGAPTSLITPSKLAQARMPPGAVCSAHPSRICLPSLWKLPCSMAWSPTTPSAPTCPL